jgi:hypothetical protein
VPIEVVIHEDEIKSCSRQNTLVHAGVTSCLTVTAVLDDELVGLHVVQFAGDSAYPERLPGLLTTFNARIQGRAIRKLYLVAPFAFYPEGVEDDVSGRVIGAPAADVIDITTSSDVGNDVYFLGYANTVQVTANGRIIAREQF